MQKKENINVYVKKIPQQDDQEELKNPQEKIKKESNIKRRMAIFFKKLIEAETEFQAKIDVELEKI